MITAAEGRCPRCRRAPPPFDVARAAGDYEGTLREIIHALKYDGRRSLAAPLAGLMRDCGREVLEGADFVIPVPLHAFRRLWRGFNQAEELARHLNLPLLLGLRRTRATLPQTGLRPAARRRNVREAFALSRNVPRKVLRNRRVVLVDDVRTTGATLEACARVLRREGAREIRALTVARALPRAGVR